MADVFVSYAHDNRQRVKPISKGLTDAGLSVWWDEHLRAGDDFAMVIERELNAAKCAVVVWSDAARNSLWVRAEATEALDVGKLVQVRVDGVKPPLPFTVVQMHDLRYWSGGRGDQPWPHVESAASAFKRSGAPAPDPRVFEGPALQDMGGTAMIGWLCIGLAMFTGALTLQAASGNVDPDLYSMAVAASFAAASVSFLVTLLRIARTAQASRRS
ncbi:MAG: toll/interleukin-1 receptor domain-containing protein [Vitreimonas sp.]